MHTWSKCMPPHPIPTSTIRAWFEGMHFDVSCICVLNMELIQDQGKLPANVHRGRRLWQMSQQEVGLCLQEFAVSFLFPISQHWLLTVTLSGWCCLNLIKMAKSSFHCSITPNSNLSHSSVRSENWFTFVTTILSCQQVQSADLNKNILIHELQKCSVSRYVFTFGGEFGLLSFSP